MTMQDYLRASGQDIGEWGHEAANNRDDMILSSILRRKTTVGALPRIIEPKNKNGQHQKKHSQIKL
jgi:hypothetical protein